MIGERRSPEPIEDERSLRDELEKLQVEVRRTRELERDVADARRERDELAAKVAEYETQDSARTISGLERQVEGLERRLAKALDPKPVTGEWFTLKVFVVLLLASLAFLAWAVLR